MAEHTFTVDLDMDGNQITNLAGPTDPTDGTNKNYVDTAITAAHTVAGAGLTESPAGTLNVGNTDANLSIVADAVNFSAGAAAVITAGPAPALSSVAPPVIPTSATSSTGVASTAARGDHTHGLALATTSLQGAMAAADKSKMNNFFDSGFYNVLDHGISTSNADTVNLSAMNTLLTAATENSTIYFPGSTSSYQFSASIAAPAKALRFMGGGATKSIIATTSATADILQVGASNTDVVGLKFATTVTRTAGSAILSGNFSTVNVYDCFFDSQFNGINYTGGTLSGVTSVIHGITFNSIVNYGVIVDGSASNIRMSDCYGTCVTGTTQAYIEVNQCDSLQVTNSKFINGTNTARIDPTGFDIIKNVSFSNVNFLSATGSAVKSLGDTSTAISRLLFTNCRFTTCATGIELAASNMTPKLRGIYISNCEFFQNSAFGLLATEVSDFGLSSCVIGGSGTAGVRVFPAFGSGTQFMITGCNISNIDGAGANAIGIDVQTGSYDCYTIANNFVADNTSQLNIVDAGTSIVPKVIRNNGGHMIQGAIATNRGAVTSSTSETLMFNAKIRANAAAAGQTFRFTCWGQTSSTGTLTFKLRAGAVGTVAGDTTVISLQTTTAAQSASAWQQFQGLIQVVSVGSSGTVGGSGWTLAGSTVTAQAAASETLATVNMTNAWFLDVTATCSAGTFTVAYGALEAL